MKIVSIVISTKNEERHIGACLDSIAAQDFPKDNLEVLVIDNNSNDRTKEIARKYGARVYNYGPERSSQRNFGVAKAVGKYILYLDADMQLSKNVILDCLKKCEDDRIIALYIPERIIGTGFWIKVRDFERSFYNATCIDAVRFIKRDAFLNIGGFDESLVGAEDWDFDRRIHLAGKTDIIASILYHDEGIFSLKRYLKKKSYYIDAFAPYITKWGRDDATIRKQLGIWYRYFWLFIRDGQWKKLLCHPILAGGIFFLRICVGFIYIVNKKSVAKDVPTN